MPIYVYECAACGEIFEEIQKVDAAAPEQPSDLDRCPTRGGGGADPCPCKLTRRLTTASHRFKLENSSDGLGGISRQGDTLIRQRVGKDGNFYGTDRAGRR